jgi:hypothetical protein
VLHTLHIILLDLIILIIFGKSSSSEAPHYAVFSTSHNVTSFRSKYCSRRPLLKFPQSMFLP